MRYFITILAVIFVIYGCGKKQKKVKNKIVNLSLDTLVVHKNKINHLKKIKDTLFINMNTVLSIKLDSLKIEKLKKMYKNNFYTIMDDVSYYKHEASEYLSSKNIKIYNTSEKIIAFKIGSKYNYFYIDSMKSYLNLILYRENHKVKEVVSIDIDIEYEEYYK